MKNHHFLIRLRRFSKRFMLGKLNEQFIIIPTIGIRYKDFYAYLPPQICFAWLFWGFSVGLGKYYVPKPKEGPHE